MKSARGVVLAAIAVLTACTGSSQAIGDVNSVIVLASDSVWNVIGDSIMTALEPRIFTVRDERTFEVTHASPADGNWTRLREFRQVVALGAAGDAWVQPIVQNAGGGAQPGTVVRARDVWARNQFATALVLPASHDAAAALAGLPRLGGIIDSVFRVYAVQRMYTSKPDTALRDTLRTQYGYGLLLPNVYASVRRSADVQLFQNSTQIGGDLVRSILITARAGTGTNFDAAQARAWRDSVASASYRPAQVTDSVVVSTPVTGPGGQGIEIQGIWEGSDPSWPTGGPFIARVIACPARNRTYLVDAWLFAPSRAKYEYMIQLQTILDTFECA